jgi:hypothetical protein
MPSYGCSFLSRDRTRGRLTPVMSSEEPAQALMRAREKEFAIAVVDDEACHKPEKCREMLLVGLSSYGEDAQRACGRIPKDHAGHPSDWGCGTTGDFAQALRFVDILIC